MDPQKNKIPIDKTIFFGALLLMLLVSAACLAFPEQALSVSGVLRNFVITKFDWFFLLFGLGVFIVCMVVGSAVTARSDSAARGSRQPTASTAGWQ